MASGQQEARFFWPMTPHVQKFPDPLISEEWRVNRVNEWFRHICIIYMKYIYVLYYIILYHIILYYTILYYTVLYYIYIYYNLWLLRRWIFSRLEPSQSASFWWKNTFLIEVGDGLSLGSSMSRNPGKSIYHPSAERHADVLSSIRAICVSGRNKTRAKLMRCCWPKDLDLLRLWVRQGIFVYLPNNQGYLR